MKKISMDFNQAIEQLQSPAEDATPAVEYLLTKRSRAIHALLERLNTYQVNQQKSQLLVCLRNLLDARAKTEKVIFRRIVVALGALQSRRSITPLLSLLTHVKTDYKLAETAGWSLATIGEPAITPIFSFARGRHILSSARSIAIVTLGYIKDPRIPSVLRGLWREVRLESPNLAISTLIALVMRGQSDEAHKLAIETEHLWHFQGDMDEYWDNYWEILKFSNSIELLHTSLERIKADDPLPAWPKALQAFGSP